jgi:replicative DNA helicase
VSLLFYSSVSVYVLLYLSTGAKGKTIPPELTIIKLLLRYEEWQKAGLDVADLPKELQGIYRCLNSYHSEANDERRDISVADLSNLYFSTLPRDRDFASGVFNALEALEVRDDTSASLLAATRKAKLLRELSLAAYEVAEGRADFSKVQALTTQLVNQDDSMGGVETCESEFITDDLEELIDAQRKTNGLRWRLQTLNRMLGSLRKGDFGFIFARPETGKTTFLASEVTHMASQLPDDAGPVFWFNNEESGQKVMRRVYQAALGVPLTEIYRDPSGYKQKYLALIKGKIKLKDDAGLSKKAVEKLCAQYKPSLIIFDQIDKIKGFENDREDLRLGTIYQWARELAKTYAPVIGVCQADGTGENVKWLTMAHVANAKTAKQAEADWIVGIGKINEIGYDALRYLHASKNKLEGDEDSDPSLRHGRCEVLIEPEVARYKDLQ